MSQGLDKLAPFYVVICFHSGELRKDVYLRQNGVVTEAFN